MQRYAIELNIALLDSQQFTTCYSQHGLNQINPRDQFTDWVLNLNPCVHLDKEELTRRLVIQVLQSSGTLIAQRLSQTYSTGAECFALRRAEYRRRRFFKNFLTSTLQRALTLKQMHHALTVTQYLDFDVPGVVDEPLQIHRTIAKRSQGFSLGARKLVTQLLGVLREPNPASATTGRSLDQQGETNRLGGLERRVGAKQFARRTWHHSNARFLCGSARLGFIAHAPDCIGAWADENRTGGDNRIGEVRVF